MSDLREPLMKEPTSVQEPALVRDVMFRLAPFAGIAVIIIGAGLAITDGTMVSVFAKALGGLFAGVFLTVAMLSYARRNDWQWYVLGIAVSGLSAWMVLQTQALWQEKLPPSAMRVWTGLAIIAGLIGLSFFRVICTEPFARRRTKCPLDSSRAVAVLTLQANGEKRQCPVWLIGNHRSDAARIVIFSYPVTELKDEGTEGTLIQIPDLVQNEYPHIYENSTLWLAYSYDAARSYEYFSRIVYKRSDERVTWKVVLDPFIYWKIEVTAGGPAALDRLRQMSASRNEA